MKRGELNNVVLFLLDQTSKVAKQHAQREFDLLEIGVTVEQWVLLKIIQQAEELSQVELAEQSFRDPASITRSLDLLAKKGLLRREPIENNRRQYKIKLTHEGTYFILQNMPLVEHLRAVGLQDFSKKEIELLKELLLRMQKNYS
ncbi:MAG: MarR family transcriptional regulator [Bacteroidia bacterium]